MNESCYDRTCADYGCAKICLDPKLHAFDACFGGKIRMGDIDAAVERNGFVLFLEWKRGGNVEEENKAQVRLHRALTMNCQKHVSVFVVGDPMKMEVERIRVMRRGDWEGDWTPATIEELRDRFSRWFSWADAQRSRRAA